MPEPIRVLVVDDSALMRHRLGTIIGSDAGCVVAGVARGGEECLAQLSTLQPDVITLDVEMPGLDGLGTLQRVMDQRPTPVIMVSSQTESGAHTTLEALSLGAVDYLAKPAPSAMAGSSQFATELLTKLRIASRVRVRKPLRRLIPAPLPAPSVPSHAPLSGGLCNALVVVGSSTGGPQALDHLLGSIEGDLPAAILVVQHMPPLFTRSLAARLARRTSMPVREVEEGDRLSPGSVLVAQGGWHMTLGSDKLLHQDQTEPVHGVRPAVDRLLASVASSWKGRCLVAILTGMGVDGTAGTRLLRARGAEVFAQDESTSIVYGMPRAVVDAGLASAVLPLEMIGPAITQWARGASGFNERLVI